jgi:hypothetical protein
VEKRPATVIHCKPRHDLAQTDAAVNGPVTLWVDDQQPFFHRTRVVLDHAVGRYGAGTVVTFTWSLLDGVWHQTSTELAWVGAEKPVKNVNTPTLPGARVDIEQVSQGRVVNTFSNFKKFRIESRIVTPDSSSTVSLPPQP